MINMHNGNYNLQIKNYYSLLRTYGEKKNFFPTLKLKPFLRCHQFHLTIIERTLLIY